MGVGCDGAGAELAAGWAEAGGNCWGLGFGLGHGVCESLGH